jgi:hypothetical protein
MAVPLMESPFAPQLLTFRDVMRICQTHRDRAFQIMHMAGAIRLGRQLRVRRQDLDDYLERLADEARIP